MSFPFRDTQRRTVELIEAREARYLLEDGETLSPAVSFRIEPGQHLRLARNRNRWTTPLIRSFAALTFPVEGYCEINGKSTSDFSFEEFAPYRAAIGFGFSLPSLLSNRTLRENLHLPMMYHWEKSPEQTAKEVLALARRFDLLPFLDRRPAYVPNGICKLVTVIRAMMRDPDFLILDDPFTGLESANQVLLVSWLESLLHDRPNLALLIASNEAAYDQRLGLAQAQTSVMESA